METALLAGRSDWGVTRSTVRVSAGGFRIVKIVIATMAAFLAMLSVAAAADLPIGKYPIGAAAPAPPLPAVHSSGHRLPPFIQNEPLSFANSEEARS